ncbi:MAG: helix-turn-helix transcriptional regulator [Desulfomonilia bacterium]|nr:helix-turn-helix domain-containing protein [Deltaproteobacteria bacterium]MDX9761655.1 helix-turn-helix transcriptional regulator [Desulfomonilia bacterium]HPW68045.1 helix-turn-helix transcriptional regulator [Deltaproteobacteria bacterium]
MNDLRSVRKSKGLTMEQLANLSGVSSKTISLYEHTPPRRPSRKVVDKLSQTLEISPDKLLGAIGARGKTSAGAVREGLEETIELDDAHVVRILGLIEKEVSELQHLMIESASLAGEHPALERSIEYLAGEIDLLTEIRQRFA